MTNPRSTSFPLRLPLSIRRSANEIAHREGMSLNQFIAIAVAEKITRLEDCYGSADPEARKTAEDTLRQYERLVEGLDEMVAVVDRDYRFVLTNRAFCKVFGRSNARIERRWMCDFIDRDVFERIILPNLNQCFCGTPVLFNMEYDLPEIGVRDFSVSFSPIEVSGEVETVGCVLRDITDMKRIEVVETGWRKRIQLAECAGLRIGLWDWDIGANTVVWSDESYRQWGFTRDTFSTRVADAVPSIHPLDRPLVESAIRNVLIGETDEYEAQYRIIRPDGSICWVDARGVMMGGASKRMIGVGIDISEQKQTQNSTGHSGSDLIC